MSFPSQQDEEFTEELNHVEWKSKKIIILLTQINES